MYLVPDDEELAIASAAAEYLADVMPIDRLHGAVPADLNDDMRIGLGEMGWFVLAVPEADGGSGLSAIEHALFFREVGRQCGPVEVLAQCLAAMTTDDEDLRASIASGKVSVSLAVADRDCIRLLGSPAADYAVLVDREEARLVALTGVQTHTRPSLDPALTMQVAGCDLQVVASRSGPHVWMMGQLATTAQLVGIAEAALDQIVDYAKVRETFGKKIGSWQAVRHPCADMAVRLEAARSQLWYAATAMKEELLDAGVHLDAAKHQANMAALANTDSNIQLHGGIGVTDEHHAHLYMKHSLVLAKLFGGKREILARLLRAELEN